MELFRELFMTAVMALVFSFLVAKLVSIAMAGDDGVDSAVKSSKIVVDRDTVTAAAVEEHEVESSKVDANETVTVVEKEEEEEEVKFDRGLRVEGTRSEIKVQFVAEEVSGKVDEFVGEILSVGGDDQIEALAAEVVEMSVELPEVGFAAQEEEVVRGIESEGIEGGECREEIVSASDESTRVVEFLGLKEGDDNRRVELNTGLDELVGEDTKIGKAMDDGDEEEIGGLLLSDDKIVEDQGTGGVEWSLNEIGEEEEGLISSHVEDADDWEGIERTEMEKIFANAAKYVDVGEKDDWFSNLGTDVQMQLYGLHKVAMEGPCRDPQPMAIKFSARAKWNAWQRLGNMSPEMAMEHYISLLSDKVPGWKKGNSAEDGKSNSSEAAQLDAPDPIMDRFLVSEKEGILELKLGAEGGDLTAGSKSNTVNKDKE